MATAMVQGALVKGAWEITHGIAAKQNKHKISEFISKITGRFKTAFGFIKDKTEKGRQAVKEAYDKVDKSETGQKLKQQYEKNLATALAYKQKLIQLGYEDVSADDLKSDRFYGLSNLDPPNLSFEVTDKNIGPVKPEFRPRTKEEKQGLVDHQGQVTIKGYLQNISKHLRKDEDKDKIEKKSWWQRNKERMADRKKQVEAEKEANKHRRKDRKGSGWLSKLFSSPLSFFVGIYLLPFRLLGKLIFGSFGEKIAKLFSVLSSNIKFYLGEGLRWLLGGIWTMMGKFSTALGTGLKYMGEAIWNRRPEWLKNAWAQIKDNWRQGREWNRKYFGRLGKRFGRLKRGIGKSLKTLGEKITDKLGWLGDKMKGWFNTLGRQLSKLGDKIVNSRGWKGVKRFFGKAGLGGRVGAWIGGKLLTGVRIAGMIATGPVGWALAIGMALWAGYSLYKYFAGKYPKFPDSPAGRISQLRMYSYGLSMNENTKFKKIFELEEIIGKFMRREDDGTVTTLDIDYETRNRIGEIFEVDFENPDGREEYVSRWLRERFLPAFREFLRVLWNQDKSKKPGELDALNRTQLAYIAYDYDPPGRIWDFKYLPFVKPSKSSMTIKEFKKLQVTVQNELSIEWETIQNKMSAEEKTKMRNINERAKNKTSANANSDRLSSIDKSDEKMSKVLNDIIGVDNSTYKTVDEQITELMEKEGYIPPDGINGPKQLYFLRAGAFHSSKEGKIIGFTVKDNGDPFDLEEYWHQYLEERGGKADMEKFRQHVKEVTENVYASQRMSIQGFYLPESLVRTIRRGTKVSYVSPEYEKRMRELELKKKAIRDAASGNYIPQDTNVDVDMSRYENNGTSFKLVDGGYKSPAMESVFGSNTLTYYGYNKGVQTPFTKEMPIQKDVAFGGLDSLDYYNTGRQSSYNVPFITDEAPVSVKGDPNALLNSGIGDFTSIGPETPPTFTSLKYPNKIIDSTLAMGDPNGIGLMPLDKVFRLASQSTGVPEPIIWAFAKMESSLNPVVKAPGKRNSATGLLQMTNAAWKTMIQWHGKKYGLTEANANRYNPLHNALLGAEFIKGNMKSITGYKSLGIDLPTALYLAHFFGPTGVKTFFAAMKNNPDALMNHVMKSAVESNPAELKDKTVRQVFEEQRAKVHEAMNKPAEKWSGYAHLKRLFPNLYSNSKPGDMDFKGLLEVTEGRKTDELENSLSMIPDPINNPDNLASSLLTNPYDQAQSFINNGPSSDFTSQLNNKGLLDTNNGGVYENGPLSKDTIGQNTPFDSSKLKDYGGEKEILGVDYGKAETLAITKHPVKEGYPFYFTSLFGTRNTGIPGASTDHKGVDIGVPSKQPGTPIVATGPGKVWRAYRSKSYGLVVYLLHDDGYQTRYAHLDRLLVREGQVVEAGDLVGLMGNTGVGSGVHLHFEVRKGHGQWSTPVDPFNFAIIKNSYKGPKVPTVIEENGNINSDKDLSEDNQQKSMLMNMGISPPDSLADALIQKDPVTGEVAYSKQEDDTNTTSSGESDYGVAEEDRSQEVKVDVEVRTDSLEKSLEETNKALRELIKTLTGLDVPVGQSPKGVITEESKDKMKSLGNKAGQSLLDNNTQTFNGKSIRANQAIRFDDY